MTFASTASSLAEMRGVGANTGHSTVAQTLPEPRRGRRGACAGGCPKAFAQRKWMPGPVLPIICKTVADGEQWTGNVETD